LTENTAKSVHQGASFSGFGFLLAEKLLPEFVHPFQLQKPILDRCGIDVKSNPRLDE
jgi:hypothetical protein